MPLLYRSYSDLHNDLTHWSKRLPTFSAVCGVPRSGIIVAAQLAQILSCPIVPIEQILAGSVHKSGFRPRVSRTLPPQKLLEAPILILDDTASAGRTRREVLPLLAQKAKVPYIYGAVYARPQAVAQWPNLLHGYGLSAYHHTFQWNLLMDRVTRTLAVDMDGILCYDWKGSEKEETENDGAKYESWILNAPPLRLPTQPVYAIITNRLERWKKQTEHWLHKHGVRYKHLDMYPGTFEQRARDWVSHKVNRFLHHKMSVSGFVESDFRQAAEIAKRTRFSVIHMESGTSWNCKSIQPPIVLAEGTKPAIFAGN